MEKHYKTITEHAQSHRGYLLTIACLAQTVDLTSLSSVTITLKDILLDIGYKPTQLQWALSAYALSYAGFLLLGGRLGDIFGHRKMFLGGMLWFAFWSLICGFAHSPIWFSVFRGLQGVGAGFTVPSALAIITTTYPRGKDREYAVHLFGASAAVGSVFGALLGGLLGSTIGWRWIMYLTALLSVIIALLAVVVIPTNLVYAPVTDRRVDYAGAISFTMGILLIIYYLSDGLTNGWGVARTLVPLFLGIGLLIVFVVIQFKIDYPIMPLHIWRHRRFLCATVTALFISAYMQTQIFFISISFQGVLHLSALMTAVAILPYGLGLIVISASIEKVLKRFPSKVLICLGFLLLIVSACLLGQLQENQSYWRFAFPAMVLAAFGLAPVWILSQSNSVIEADEKDQGLVCGMYNVTLQSGGSLGIAIATVVMNHVVPPTTYGPALMPGIKAAFYTVAVFAAFGFFATLILGMNTDLEKNEDEANAADTREGGGAGVIVVVVDSDKDAADKVDATVESMEIGRVGYGSSNEKAPNQGNDNMKCPPGQPLSSHDRNNSHTKAELLQFQVAEGKTELAE